MSEHEPEHSRRQEFINGAKATFPLVVGAIPFGIIFGALAITAGLSPTASQGMSLFVFAGSSQFLPNSHIMNTATPRRLGCRFCRNRPCPVTGITPLELRVDDIQIVVAASLPKAGRAIYLEFHLGGRNHARGCDGSRPGSTGQRKLIPVPVL